jgi:hypothetical protein
VLRFYADKARRQHLPEEQYEIIVAEIDRMIEKGTDYDFASHLPRFFDLSSESGIFLSDREN